MKKYLMFIFLVLFCSILSARYIFDGKIVFSKHGTSRDRFAYLIIERQDGTVEDTFAIIDTLGNVYWKDYKVYAEFDSLKTGVIWTLSGDKHYFVLGTDTAYIQLIDGTLKFHSNHNRAFSFEGGGPIFFYSNLQGFGDGYFKTDGCVWGLDNNNTSRYSYIFFHEDDEHLKADSIGEILEWTGRGGFLAKGAKLTERLKVVYDVSEWWDTLAHIQADTSGVDERWVTGLLINGEAINDSGDFPLKLEDRDGNILFTVKGDGLMEGYNLNRQFSFQCAGDIFNMTPNTIALLGWITPATTEEDLSPHNHDFSYHGFATSDRTAIGLVWKLGFDPGQANYLDTPDHDDFTFDDAGGANGFTMGGWYKIKASVAPQTMWSKWDETTGLPRREWRMFLDDDETLVMMLWDESNDTDPYRTSDAAISVGWHLILAVYDGAGGNFAANGITLYVDGKVEASTATNDISYIGMENTTIPVSVGVIEGTAGQLTNFWSDDMGHQFITPDQLTSDEIWELHLRTRGYFNE